MRTAPMDESFCFFFQKEALACLPLHQSNVARFVSGDVRSAVIRAHAGIEAAIRAGDTEAARRRMARHVRTYREQVATVAPESIGIAMR